MRSTLCILLLLLFLSACNQKYYIGIETYNPSEVTFPDNVKKVLVVNNAVPQPANVGAEYILYGNKQDGYSANADSAIWTTCYSLGKAIVAKDYFSDVLLYHEAIREDDEFLVDKKLTLERVNELCLSNSADAVISLDRLLFNSTRTIMKREYGTEEGKIIVEVNGVIRAYMPNKANSFATVIIEDSVIFHEYGNNIDILNYFLPSPDDALKVAGYYIGELSANNFAPHWTEEKRWYFSSSGSKWKEATAFARASKWDAAAELWTDIYNKNNKWLPRAKAASNIALANEIIGNLEKAKEWAEISSGLYGKNAPEDDEDRKLLALYVQAIVDRILESRKLDKQIGIE